MFSRSQTLCLYRENLTRYSESDTSKPDHETRRQPILARSPQPHSSSFSLSRARTCMATASSRKSLANRRANTNLTNLAQARSRQPEEINAAGPDRGNLLALFFRRSQAPLLPPQRTRRYCTCHGSRSAGRSVTVPPACPPTSQTKESLDVPLSLASLALYLPLSPRSPPAFFQIPVRQRDALHLLTKPRNAWESSAC